MTVRAYGNGLLGDVDDLRATASGADDFNGLSGFRHGRLRLEVIDATHPPPLYENRRDVKRDVVRGSAADRRRRKAPPGIILTPGRLGRYAKLLIT
jgi:hypothetical protein